MAEQAENKSWYQKTWWKITSYFLVFLFGVSVGQDSEKKAERAEAVVVEKIVVAEKPPTAVAEKPLVLDPFPQRPVDPPIPEAEWSPPSWGVGDYVIVSDAGEVSKAPPIPPLSKELLNKVSPATPSFVEEKEKERMEKIARRRKQEWDQAVAASAAAAESVIDQRIKKRREKLARLAGPSDEWGQKYAAVAEQQCKKDIEKLLSFRKFEWLKHPDGSLFTHAYEIEDHGVISYWARLKMARRIGKSNMVHEIEGPARCQYNILSGTTSDLEID